MNKQQTDSLQNDDISALADGALQGDAFAEAVRQVGLGGEARARWHAYHVVGDVLRSEQLAACSGDLAFLSKLEARLALEPAPAAVPVRPAEPVAVVRPDAQAAANGDVFRWKMAAGFASLAAVAAIGWQSLQWQAPGAGGVLAQGPATGAASDIQAASVDPGSPAGQVQPVMLRNAQLDELLAAHNRAVGGAALQSQARLLRNVSVEDQGR